LGNQLIALDATGHLAEVMEVRGSFREGIVQCKASVDRNRDRAGKPLPISGLVHVPLGMLYYATDDLSHSQEHLVLGIELCERLGMVYFWVVGKCALAKLEHAGGDWNEAWNSLADARELAVRSQSPRRQRIVAATTADFEIREGNIEAARRTLEAAAGLPGVTTDALRLVEARLLLVQHKPSQAWRLLQSMDEQASREGAHGLLVAINVLAARCKHALGQHEGARERLASAVSMAVSGNQRRVFLDEGAQLAPLLEEVREVAPVFVNELIALLLHGDTGEASGALLEPLTKSELKVLTLLNQGLTNKEIADRLTLTLGTTKWRIGQIFGKLSVRNRTEAVARARKLKLI
jgi:LuxR family maltose regulon positive regulatory protein